MRITDIEIGTEYAVDRRRDPCRPEKATVLGIERVTERVTPFRDRVHTRVRVHYPERSNPEAPQYEVVPTSWIHWPWSEEVERRAQEERNQRASDERQRDLAEQVAALQVVFARLSLWHPEWQHSQSRIDSDGPHVTIRIPPTQVPYLISILDLGADCQGPFVSDITPEDRALAAFFEVRMADIASTVTDDLVARVTADDAAKDELIADLVLAVRWYQGPFTSFQFTQEKQAIGRALAYVRSVLWLST